MLADNPMWPSCHLERIAMHVLGVTQEPITQHVLVSCGFTVGFPWLAVCRLRRIG